MNNSLAGLDWELQNRLSRIEWLDTELFFEQIKLAGLKAAKEALL
jgi:hypothetical protein